MHIYIRMRFFSKDKEYDHTFCILNICGTRRLKIMILATGNNGKIDVCK